MAVGLGKLAQHVGPLLGKAGSAIGNMLPGGKFISRLLGGTAATGATVGTGLYLDDAVNGKDSLLTQVESNLAEGERAVGLNAWITSIKEGLANLLQLLGDLTGNPDLALGLRTRLKANQVRENNGGLLDRTAESIQQTPELGVVAGVTATGVAASTVWALRGRNQDPTNADGNGGLRTTKGDRTTGPTQGQDGRWRNADGTFARDPSRTTSTTRPPGAVPTVPRTADKPGLLRRIGNMLPGRWGKLLGAGVTAAGVATGTAHAGETLDTAREELVQAIPGADLTRDVLEGNITGEDGAIVSTSELVGGFSAVAATTATGAAIGTFIPIPVLGTAFGAAVGGAVGLVASGVAYEYGAQAGKWVGGKIAGLFNREASGEDAPEVVATRGGPVLNGLAPT